MDKITLNMNLRGYLPDLSKPFAHCDEAGYIVDRYIPATLGPPLSREEIERRKHHKEKTLTTAEVLVHLEKL
jgi:hypothetical protein